jgi:malate synthase
MLDAALKPSRSWLFTPAAGPDRFAKAAASGADVAILDVEDSAAPSDKHQARDTALGFLKTLRINGRDMMARISTSVIRMGSSRKSLGRSLSASVPRPPFIRAISARSIPL